MHIHILIDGSGSMGFMKGAGEEHENKYLIDEKHTRTDLVKNILINHLIPNLTFAETVTIELFLNVKKVNNEGIPIKSVNGFVEEPKLIHVFSGLYDNNKINDEISKIKNPEPGGTPLRQMLIRKINRLNSTDHHIIVFSDGDGYWNSKIDQDWDNIISNVVNNHTKKIIIHFIGIAQNDSAQSKSKRLCSNTGGTYLNLQSMNYNSKQLNILLFNLKASIASNAIKLHATNIVKEPQAVPIQSNETGTNPEKIDQPEKIDLEIQVFKNTKSLEIISTQLSNIVNLLSAKQENQEEVEIFEDEEHNKNIGKLAEQYLYNELLKNKWDIIWLNEKNESGKPYDFEITTDKGKFYYECKGTIGNGNEFLLTKSEWLFYLENRDNYRLCFVRNVKSQPTYVRFLDLIDDMKEGKIMPCSSKNIKLKADRIIFQVLV